MPVSIERLLAGCIISIVIGAIAYWRKSLTGSGWLGAVITGTLTFGFGGLVCGAALVMFFVTSTLLSRFRQGYKERLAGEKFEKGGRRDLLQALANGGAGALAALAYGVWGEPAVLLAVFAGALGSVNADTWATELGVLNRRPPRLITTLREAAPGTSGAVSAVGTAAAAAGALTIGATLLVALGATGRGWPWWLLPAALAGGVAGSMCDSALGAMVQAIYQGPAGETERARAADGTPHRLLRGWGWMNNDAVNFLSSLAGALVSAAVYLAVG